MRVRFVFWTFLFTKLVLREFFQLQSDFVLDSAIGTICFVSTQIPIHVVAPHVLHREGHTSYSFVHKPYVEGGGMEHRIYSGNEKTLTRPSVTDDCHRSEFEMNSLPEIFNSKFIFKL